MDIYLSWAKLERAKITNKQNKIKNNQKKNENLSSDFFYFIK